MPETHSRRETRSPCPTAALYKWTEFDWERGYPCLHFWHRTPGIPAPASQTPTDPEKKRSGSLPAPVQSSAPYPVLCDADTWPEEASLYCSPSQTGYDHSNTPRPAKTGPDPLPRTDTEPSLLPVSAGEDIAHTSLHESPSSALQPGYRSDTPVILPVQKDKTAV